MNLLNKTYIQFIILVLVSLGINELANYFLDIKDLFYTSLSENLTDSQINTIKELHQKWNYVGYLFLPIYMLLKIAVIASIVYIGIFFFNSKEVTFGKIFKYVIFAEYKFLCIPIIKIIWFGFVDTHFNYQDVTQFYPLSGLNIVGTEGLENWLIYPFQTFNAFELAYLFVLAFYVGKLTQTNMDKGFKIVAYSYVPALLLWVSAVMFFILSNS